MEDKNWIPIEDGKRIPEVKSDIFKVRLEDGEEVWAYFYSDQCSHLNRYFNVKNTYWWDKKTKKPLYNVTHWRE